MNNSAEQQVLPFGNGNRGSPSVIVVRMWQPPDVLCEPEWLASDLVASLADLEGIQG